jgi:hypothetical protein
MSPTSLVERCMVGDSADKRMAVPAHVGTGSRSPNSDLQRWPARLSGADLADGRRARLRRVEPHSGDGVPNWQRWRRRDRCRQGVRDADRAQRTVMYDMDRRPLRGLPRVVSASMANWGAAELISDDRRRRQRNRCEKNDLTPHGEQGRGKPNPRFQPAETHCRLVLHQAPHKENAPAATVARIAAWGVSGKTVWTHVMADDAVEAQLRCPREGREHAAPAR